jgi:hypothetical protein
VGRQQVLRRCSRCGRRVWCAECALRCWLRCGRRARERDEVLRSTAARGAIIQIAALLALCRCALSSCGRCARLRRLRVRMRLLVLSSSPCHCVSRHCGGRSGWERRCSERRSDQRLLTITRMSVLRRLAARRDELEGRICLTVRGSRSLRMRCAYTRGRGVMGRV